ncbi:lysM domain receptor-like kinase 3 [Malania oleifera]|uniref:lysM domain receptor-like kinase 3 n=1 Tax=Malania oleifera TaxID=397392 RepID=UPI0025ADAB3F|nr:lysM domain receptor-like kinase 3 [Malania oleifera]
MCKSKRAVQVAEPSPAARSPRTVQSPRPRRPTRPSTSGASSSTSDPSTSNPATATATDTGTGSSWRTSASSRTSLSSLRDSLPENPHIYDFAEVRSATNNFLAKRFSPSSSAACWRCSLRRKDVIVFQRKFRRSIETAQLREMLSVVCRSHHISIIKLLGVSISGSHIYLVYDFVNGASLADCLRNPRSPDFTVLSTWVSRMQIATDLAHGLDYIHNNTGLKITLVHNHIKSNSIVVTEPSFNAKICHFGTAVLCGEATDDRAHVSPPPPSQSGGEITEIVEEESLSSKSSKFQRSDSRATQFEGARGYMSPEFRSAGVATQKSDVYAFGVVILELLSGEEPLKFKFEKERGNFTRTSVIETARAAIDGEGEGEGEGEGGGGGDDGGGGSEGRVRRWVDRRLNDSFPVEVAEEMTRLALDCVHVDSDKRPNMRRVAGKISKLYLKSRIWSDSVRLPTGISLSLAPR